MGWGAEISEGIIFCKIVLLECQPVPPLSQFILTHYFDELVEV